jgi:hypothetical protein
LTDAQLQTELQNVIAAQKRTANSSTEFFMFTAKGVGSCFDGTSSACSFRTYCGYHRWIGGGTTATLYANMPDASTANCDVGQHPHGDDADATINVTSHEYIETITDQQGNAWWNSQGYEIGDKYAWNFGTTSGVNRKKYNQAINGHNYFMQQEWSNASNKCVLILKGTSRGDVDAIARLSAGSTDTNSVQGTSAPMPPLHCVERGDFLTGGREFAGDLPVVPEWINDPPQAPAVLFDDGRDLGRAGGDRLLTDRCRVFDDQQHPHRAAA